MIQSLITLTRQAVAWITGEGKDVPVQVHRYVRRYYVQAVGVVSTRQIVWRAEDRLFHVVTAWNPSVYPSHEVSIIARETGWGVAWHSLATNIEKCPACQGQGTRLFEGRTVWCTLCGGTKRTWKNQGLAWGWTTDEGTYVGTLGDLRSAFQSWKANRLVGEAVPLPTTTRAEGVALD